MAVQHPATGFCIPFASTSIGCHNLCDTEPGMVSQQLDESLPDCACCAKYSHIKTDHHFPRISIRSVRTYADRTRSIRDTILYNYDTCIAQIRQKSRFQDVLTKSTV